MTVHSQGSTLHFFAEGNTARGSMNLFDSSLQHLERLYILKGGPGTGKSTLIRTLSASFVEQGFNIWQIHCARDNESLDGVIVPSLKVGIVDGTAPHVIEPRWPGAVEQYVNLGAAWDPDRLKTNKLEIQRLNSLIDATYEKAYAGFAEALHIHDDWEAVFIQNMDFNAANALTQQFIKQIIGNQKAAKESRLDRRFLGAATPNGAVDFVPNLTEGLKRYFIKGRPGSGKSTMLKQIANAAAERGFDVETYHCGFDPKSIDMVIVRELDFAIFDSTPPHEYFPERDGDEIIDMYENCIKQDTDEKYAEEIENFRKQYSVKMKESIALLAEANDFHKELERIYIAASDFGKVDQIRKDIEQEIARMV